MKDNGRLGRAAAFVLVLETPQAHTDIRPTDTSLQWCKFSVWATVRTWSNESRGSSQIALTAQDAHWLKSFGGKGASKVESSERRKAYMRFLSNEIIRDSQENVLKGFQSAIHSIFW